MMSSLFSILLIILGLGGLIFVHELGHFLMAKWAGVKVEVFSIGFGWSLAKIPYGETEYCIRAIPLGGYVRMAGEMPDDERTGADYELQSQPIWKRFLIFVAGATMNLLVVVPLCMTMYWVGVDVPTNQIATIKPDSAEWKAGLQTGDTLVGFRRGSSSKTGFRPVKSLREYQEAMLSTDQSESLELKVRRNGKHKKFTISPPAEQIRPGIQAPSNVVKMVKPGSPADRADLQSGDKIVRFEGLRIQSARDLHRAKKQVMNPEVQYVVRRRSGQKDIESLDFPLETPFILTGDYGNKVIMHSTSSLSIRKQLSLEEGDEIQHIHFLGNTYQVNGTVRNQSEYPGDATTVSTPGKNISMTIQRKGRKQDVSISFREEEFAQNRFGSNALLLYKPLISTVQHNSPADRAGLEAGDQIVSLAGMDTPTMHHISTILDMYPKQKISITFERNGKTKQTNITPRENHWGEGTIGISFQLEQNPHPLHHLPKNSVYREAGIQKGDRIVGLENSEGEMKYFGQSQSGSGDVSYADLRRVLSFTRSSSIVLQILRSTEGKEQYQKLEVSLNKKREPRLGIGLQVETFSRKYGFVQGMKEGVKESKRMIMLTLGSFEKMFASSNALQNLKGPVGIAQISFHAAERGMGRFLMILVMISISLGILNLLPFPPLDGGHVLFLLFEAIKGEPINEEVQATFQIIGVVLLLFVFVLVTYNDFINMFT